MNGRRETDTRVVEASVLEDLRDSAIATAGLIEAISSGYVYEGVLSTGALVYVASAVSAMADKLSVLVDGDQAGSPPF